VKWLENNRAATSRVEGIRVGAFCLFAIDFGCLKKMYEVRHRQMVELHFMDVSLSAI